MGKRRSRKRAREQPQIAPADLSLARTESGIVASVSQPSFQQRRTARLRTSLLLLLTVIFTAAAAACYVWLTRSHGSGDSAQGSREPQAQESQPERKSVASSPVAQLEEKSEAEPVPTTPVRPPRDLQVAAQAKQQG